MSNLNRDGKPDQYKEYRKKGTQSMRPYIPGEDLNGICFAREDTPELGGMIAENKYSPRNRWYVGKVFFEKNYEEA